MIDDISNCLLKFQFPELSKTLKSPKTLLLVALWVSAVVLSSNAMAQSLSKPADLKASPAPEAKTVKSVAANVSVKLLKRQGFWVEVSADGATGWIKLSDVNMSAASGPGLSAVDTGRTGKGNIVSTSAARGLSDKELTSAKPDAQQFEQLKARRNRARPRTRVGPGPAQMRSASKAQQGARPRQARASEFGVA